MKFEYEISLEDYVSSQMLYAELTQHSRRLKSAVLWSAAGILFIVVAFRQDPGWVSVLLGMAGASWICLAVQGLFPGYYLRRLYPKTGLSGKKFQAELNEEGFEVAGDLCTWRVRWAGVTAKGENKHVFMLYGANTLFMFGKKYLTDDQQRELRKLAALPIVEPT